MTEVLPGVRQIDPSPEPSFTTHLYLLKDGPSDWTLIDTGLPGADAALRTYLAAERIDPHAIRRILITHLHRDHVGALKATAALTGAKVYAHWIEAAFLRGHPPYDGPGVPPAEPLEVDVAWKDGDRIEAFGGLVAYHLPGHTAGHAGYFQPERRVLFSGDLFFGQGSALELSPAEYTLHTGTAKVSAMRVAGLGVESLMSYHGGPWPKGAGARVEKLVRGFP